LYACICHAVTDDQVVAAVDAGAGSVDAVGEATFAGTGCGGCHPTLEELIQACAGCPLVALVA